MIPTNFSESNINFKAPPDLDESQVRTIFGYTGQVSGGSLDGCPNCVVAWLPTDREKELIMKGEPIYLSFIGGVPPHFLSMSFHEATHPA